MDTNTAPRFAPATAWWAARTGMERAFLTVVGTVVGLVLGAGLGMGVASALGGQPADEAVAVPVEPSPEPTVPETPAPTVPETTTTTTTIAPAPEPTIPPTTTTVDPRPARRAEIAEEVRILNGRIDQRRSEINAQRMAEVEACDAESERLRGEYDQRVADTEQAVADYEEAKQDFVLHFAGRHHDIALAMQGRLSHDPAGQAIHDRSVAAAEAVIEAEEAQAAALAAGQAQGEACQAQRAAYGPIDDDPQIQQMLAERVDLIAEYESLG